MAMRFHSFFSIALSSLYLFVLLSVTEAKNGGFSVDLIHRDSPKSPFHNPSLTPQQHMNNALRRSFSRVNHFLSLSNKVSASTDVVPDGGEFVMKISLGTPAVPIIAIADTGSDLIWVQCAPCDHCYKQKAPLFSSNSSSSYNAISCSSEQCQSVRDASCDSDTNTCVYSMSYGDQSHSFGDLATETLRLGSTTRRPVSLPNTIFGCGRDNDGTFNESGSGIVGLGGGQVSLISQMGSTISGIFSYCLVPTFSQRPSKMNFGDSGVVSGSGVVSTPLVSKSPETFYFLTLDGMTVNGERLDFNNTLPSSTASKLSEEGNIIIDSGTTLTLLPSDLYNQLETAVERAINSETITDPQGILSLCYANLADQDVPIITAHFRGADLKLNSMNTFVRTSSDTMCLAFTPSDDYAIYGNLAQMNFLVGYDLERKFVLFQPTDCTNH